MSENHEAEVARMNNQCRNLKLLLQYDGTDYHGWQIQSKLPTLQGTLTQAVLRITREKVQLHSSGRTDAGVHALGQVCNFLTCSPIPLSNFHKALNSLLPASIRVLQVEEVDQAFHARRSVVRKHYRYRILTSKWCSPFDYRFAHHCPCALDFQAMSEAAGRILGEHDFTSFCDSDSEVKSKVRRVVSSFFVFDSKQDLIEYNVCANGFLHHMVRNLVGTFLEVGKGRWTVSSVDAILNASNRSIAGPTAPAKGLFLVSVSY
jgi:tRNA pseudouridine38-40 synthase